MKVKDIFKRRGLVGRVVDSADKATRAEN